MKKIKLENGLNLGHLTLKNEIAIDGNAVFVGPNGVGKSTLFSYICKQLGETEILTITDQDLLQDIFDVSEEAFIIKANINKIHELESQIAVIEAKQKSVATTNLPNDLETDIYKNAKLLERSEIIIPKSEDVKKIFLTKTLQPKIWKLKKQIEDEKTKMLASITREEANLWMGIYNQLEQKESDKCFVCQNSISYQDVLSLWKTKIGELKNNVEVDISKVNDLSKDDYSEFVSYVTDSKFEDIIVGIQCEFDNDGLDTFKKNLQTLNEYKMNLEGLNIEAENLYKSLTNKSSKTFIKNFFEKYYDIAMTNENIIFDDIKNEIRIKLNRKIENYSSGEKNLLLIYIKLYKFLYSDKKILIMDDLITSLDNANLCLVSCFIEDVIKINNNKNFIIFTHNTSFAFNIPYTGTKFWWVDRIGSDLVLFEFKSKQLIKIRDLLKEDDFFEKIYNLNDHNKVLHYDLGKSNDKNYEKHQKELFNFIKLDNLNLENLGTFNELLIAKEKILLSIRINIEKFVADVIDKCANKIILLKGYRDKKTVNNRIQNACKDDEFVRIWNNKFVDFPVDALLKSKILLSNYTKHNEFEKQQLDLFLLSPILSVSLNYLKLEQETFLKILNNN
jgi:ABC-type multidrug transport system ATPase subunit